MPKCSRRSFDYPCSFRQMRPRAAKAGLAIAQDALRKIRLGHPCDVPELIAAYALEEIEGVLAS